MLCKTTFGMLHPLAHLACGPTQRNILHNYCELGHSIGLTIAIHDVVDYNFLWFPKIHECIENLQECRHNLLGLLGFNKEQQHLVIEKIKALISKICHRAIANIHH